MSTDAAKAELAGSALDFPQCGDQPRKLFNGKRKYDGLLPNEMRRLKQYQKGRFCQRI
jgi:hypothetical protein